MNAVRIIVISVTVVICIIISYIIISHSEEPVKRTSLSEGDNYRFLAFARIYSGTIKRGQKLYVLGPKHDPAEAIDQVHYRILVMK